MSRPIDAVIDFLKAEKARGRSHVFIDEAARKGLREFYLSIRNPDAASVGATSTSQPTLQAAISKGGKEEQLAGLRIQAETWAPACSLGTLRTKMVFATGSPDAEIMMVGDAPGHYEEKEGEPFIGPAGRKLNDILRAMGLKRENVYISNLVKFRPAMPRQTTNNRKPTPSEIAACLPLIMAEISVVRPKIIIALGATAAEGLIGLEGTIGSMREQWHEISGIPARVTYHPSYLLQSSSNEVKRSLWEDMLATMDKLGMSITEKQRAFFLPKP